MRNKVLRMALLWLSAHLCVSCYYPQHVPADGWDCTEEACDSIDFAATHHYTHNFNFLVCRDSLWLFAAVPEGDARERDSAGAGEPVWKGDRLAVADIRMPAGDSVGTVWVKVARDQQTMGWLPEHELLDGVVPDDPISQFIHVFSDIHLIYFLSVLGVLLVLFLVRRLRRKRFRIVHFDDIASCYPTLLCLTLSASATLYASIQMFVPQTWTEFYFHPTLNPFGLPLILGLFLASVWLIVLLSMATADDVLRQLSPTAALSYFFSLLGVCVVCYLFFTLTTLYYVGYPCLALYAVWALRRYWRHGRCRYRCGYCGAKLHDKGVCPRCGTVNE
ncbi:MAG: zinc ribbon domain-containing protein [Paraprevotella sp.]|nr:zinc ribbon domain-containing protein [Paraprevotella sp.]